MFTREINKEPQSSQAAGSISVHRRHRGWRNMITDIMKKSSTRNLVSETHYRINSLGFSTPTKKLKVTRKKRKQSKGNIAVLKT